MTNYRKKCQQLEEEKVALKQVKHQLELEVAQLREELDVISLTSTISSITTECESPLQNRKAMSVSM